MLHVHYITMTEMIHMYENRELIASLKADLILEAFKKQSQMRKRSSLSKSSAQTEWELNNETKDTRLLYYLLVYQ